MQNKQRMINTKFWDDTYINRLEPIEKLLYLYFLTNPLTSWCGIYEIPIQRIVFDTNITIDIINKALDRFAQDDKIFYVDGYICVKNFIKNQNINKNTEIAVKRELNEIPERILLNLVKKISPNEPFSTLPNDSEGLGDLYLTKLNLTKLICKVSEHQEIILVMDVFKQINPTINFGHKTHRTSISVLLKEFGFEETLKLAKLAISIQGQKYAPVITTPTDLRNKLGALGVYIKKEQNAEPKGIVIN